MFVVPIYYVIALVIFYLFIPNPLAVVVFAILLPLSGVVATDLLKQ